jgi:hypothetical protein
MTLVKSLHKTLNKNKETREIFLYVYFVCMFIGVTLHLMCLLDVALKSKESALTNVARTRR